MFERVALGQVAPGIEDRDHGAIADLFAGIPHLRDPAAVAEAPQVIRREPSPRGVLPSTAGHRKIAAMT